MGKDIEEYIPNMTFLIKDLTDEQLHTFAKNYLKSTIINIDRDYINNTIIFTISNKKNKKITIKIIGNKYDYKMSYVDPNYDYLGEENISLRRHWSTYLSLLYGNDYVTHIYKYLNMMYKKSLKILEEHNVDI